MTTPRPGRVLGIDYGRKRVGLAISDELRIAANPLEVLLRIDAVARIVGLTDEYNITEIVIGLPTSLAGQEGDSAREARQLGAEIEAATGHAVTYIDERFSSHIAERVMLEAGASRRSRRKSLDKVAATVILQSFLDRQQ